MEFFIPFVLLCWFVAWIRQDSISTVGKLTYFPASVNCWEASINEIFAFTIILALLLLQRKCNKAVRVLDTAILAFAFWK